MLSTIVTPIVTLASVLLGAGITWWLNVRTRRSNRIEDLFDAAIDATAVADASVNWGYLAGMRPAGMTDEDFQALSRQLNLDGYTNYFKRAGEAREAIARVARYEPRVKPYYQSPLFLPEQIREVTAILTEGKSRYAKERKAAGSKSKREAASPDARPPDAP
jgi:hypothetical protein